MKMITATMAKNIANDFLNNKCGPAIQTIMDEILLKAQQGRHCSDVIIFPKDWDDATRNSVIRFFIGLGYEVDSGSVGMAIKWEK